MFRMSKVIWFGYSGGRIRCLRVVGERVFFRVEDVIGNVSFGNRW